MILSSAEITAIIKDNPGLKKIQQGNEYLKKMRRHMYGEGLDEYTSNIAGYERSGNTDTRKKYQKSNKDLYSRLGRPIDKVFTAKGGSLYYNLPDTQTQKAAALVQSLPGGLTVRKWVETQWKPHMLDDPFGIVFMEILPETEAVRAKNEGRSFVYPTYKPINTIYDYYTSGNKLEWVVFSLTKEQKNAAGIKDDLKAFRVVDDAFDYYVIMEGDAVRILQDHTFPNYFGQVPGIVNSDISDPANEDYFLSFYDEIIELAEHFWLKGSIKVTHDFLHGFPKYSEFADDCISCKGTGSKAGADCEDCSGTGRRRITSVSDVKLLSWPNTKEDTLILPNQVGGYISPDKTFYEIATDDLRMLEDTMNVTLWGMQSKLKTSGMSAGDDSIKTATEVMDEMKPQADRLFIISEMAEKRHKFILDFIIKLQITQSHKGSSVNYGRRYLLESPDSIWKKYSDARTAGAPQNVLDTLLNEYYESNYQSDPVGLSVAKKLMYVEPFVHFRTSELQSLNPSEEDYKAKLYFGEWLSVTEEGELISKDIKGLKESLYAFTATKEINKPEPARAAA